MTMEFGSGSQLFHDSVVGGLMFSLSVGGFVAENVILIPIASISLRNSAGMDIVCLRKKLM